MKCSKCHSECRPIHFKCDGCGADYSHVPDEVRTELAEAKRKSVSQSCGHCEEHAREWEKKLVEAKRASDEKDATIAKLNQCPWCGQPMERIQTDGGDELGCTSEKCPSWGIGVWCYADSLVATIARLLISANDYFDAVGMDRIKMLGRLEHAVIDAATPEANLAQRDREQQAVGMRMLKNKDGAKPDWFDDWVESRADQHEKGKS